jgi:hypothetical protein
MLKIFLIISLLLLASPSFAACPAQHVKETHLVGRGEMRLMLWHLYDAELYAPGAKYDADKPFTLRLLYKRNIRGDDIARVSVDEMKKNGLSDNKLLDRWQQAMEGIFPDVASGDSLTGFFTGSRTIFCQGDRNLGEVEGPDFARHFFGIWLSEKTSAPALRKKLLGLS